MRWDHEMKKARRRAARIAKKQEERRAAFIREFEKPIKLFTKMTFDESVRPSLLDAAHLSVGHRYTSNWVMFLVLTAYAFFQHRPYKLASAFLMRRSRIRLFGRSFLHWNPLLYYFFFIAHMFNLKFLYNVPHFLVDLRYLIYIYFFVDTYDTLDIDHFLKRRVVKLMRFSDAHFPFDLGLLVVVRTYVRYLRVFKYNEHLFNNDAKHIAYNNFCAPPTGPEGCGALFTVEPYMYRNFMFRNINFYKVWSAKIKRPLYNNMRFYEHIHTNLNYVTFWFELYSKELLSRRVYQSFWSQVSNYFPYSLYLMATRYREFNRRWTRSFAKLNDLHYSHISFQFPYFGVRYMERALLSHTRRFMTTELRESPTTMNFLALQTFSIEDITAYYLRCPSVIVRSYVVGFVDYIEQYFFNDFSSEIHSCGSETVLALYRYLYLDIIRLLIVEDEGEYEQLARSYDWNTHNLFASLAYNSAPSAFPALSFPEEHWMLKAFRWARGIDVKTQLSVFQYTTRDGPEVRYYLMFMYLMQDYVFSILYHLPLRLHSAEVSDLKLALYRHFKFHFSRARCDNRFNHFINNHTWDFFVP